MPDQSGYIFKLPQSQPMGGFADPTQVPRTGRTGQYQRKLDPTPALDPSKRLLQMGTDMEDQYFEDLTEVNTYGERMRMQGINVYQPDPMNPESIAAHRHYKSLYKRASQAANDLAVSRQNIQAYEQGVRSGNYQAGLQTQEGLVGVDDLMKYSPSSTMKFMVNQWNKRNLRTNDRAQIKKWEEDREKMVQMFADYGQRYAGNVEGADLEALENVVSLAQGALKTPSFYRQQARADASTDKVAQRKIFTSGRGWAKNNIYSWNIHSWKVKPTGKTAQNVKTQVRFGRIDPSENDPIELGGRWMMPILYEKHPQKGWMLKTVTPKPQYKMTLSEEGRKRREAKKQDIPFEEFLEQDKQMEVKWWTEAESAGAIEEHYGMMLSDFLLIQKVQSDPSPPPQMIQYLRGKGLWQ